MAGARGGGLSYALTSPYESLVTALEVASYGADCGPTKSTERFRREDGGLVIFDGYLHLKEWKARASSPKERVNILLHIQETIQHADWILLRSTVRICYFNIQDANAKLLQSVRFDYGPEQPAHPLFHAQMSDEPIQLSETDADDLEFQFERTPGDVVCFKNARIPTSDMTFPSVLLCLAADHLGPPFFSEFMKRVVELQQGMPHATFGKLQASIAAQPNHLRSSHWFAHC